MKFHIIGVERRTADDVKFMLEAPTPAAAEQEANRMGVLVERVLPQRSVGSGVFRTYVSWWRSSAVVTAAAHLLLAVPLTCIVGTVAWYMASSAPDLLAPDDAAFFRERQAAIDRLGGTPHVEKMWLLALQMSARGYYFTGSGEPLLPETPSLAMAVCGAPHLSRPDTWPFDIQWRLDAVSSIDKARSLLSVEINDGRYDQALLRAFEDEWGRFIVSPFPKLWIAGAHLVQRADFHHQDLVAGRPQRDYRGKFSRVDYKVLAYDRMKLGEEAWKYRVELEHVVGDCTLKVSIIDRTRLPDDEPWGWIVMWFIYTPPAD